MKINNLNYDGHEVIVDIDKEILIITVVVFTGDEITTIYYKDENGDCYSTKIDQGGRGIDFYDGSYIVQPNEIEEWLKRKSSLDWFKTLYEREEA